MEAAEIVARLGGVVKAAERLGQKRTTVSMWLHKRRLPVRHVRAVARALDVSIEDVWPASRSDDRTITERAA